MVGVEKRVCNNRETILRNLRSIIHCKADLFLSAGLKWKIIFMSRHAIALDIGVLWKLTLLLYNAKEFLIHTSIMPHKNTLP